MQSSRPVHLEEPAHSRAASTALLALRSRTFARHLSRLVRRRTRAIAAHPTVQTGWGDACEASARIVRSIRVPNRQELLGFLGHQALVNTVAWCAGLAAVGIVTSFFEERSVYNLWGLIPSQHRALVSADDSRMILSLTSFCAGLTMTIFVRHVLLRWIAEIRVVRSERCLDATKSPGLPSPPAARKKKLPFRHHRYVAI